MPQSLSAVYIHLIFSTKFREPLITAELAPRLFAYLGGIARECSAAPILVNGMDDHVHLLLTLPTAMSIADLVRTLKSNSSKWVHELGAEHAGFGWQSGYAAFSVSRSNVDAVRAYIADQQEHHRRATFAEEYLGFLRRHGVDYDPKFVLD